MLFNPSIARLFFLLISFGYTLSLSGQAYHPFPDKGTWYFGSYGDMGQPIPGYQVFKTLGDTSLSGHNYKKLFLNAYYYGALRDSSKQIFYRAAEDSLEHLLYDFNRKAGDTIIAPYPLEGLGYICDTVLIQQEDQLLTMDGPRRRLSMYGCNPVEWIEGVGTTWWLTRPAYLGSVSGGTFLTCSFDSSRLVYALDGAQCASNTKEGINESDLMLFPNPTSGSLSLVAPYSGLQSIHIFDVTGREMLRFPADVANLDISSLPDGIYWLTIQTKTQKKTLKVVKLAGQ